MTAREASNEAESGQGARRAAGWIPCALLLALAAAVLVVRFHPFLVPNNDFHTFDDAARALAEGRLPFESKRLPLFPALMALAAPLLSGAQPTLQAALLWNALFCLGSLAALFALARRFGSAAAAVAGVLYLASVQLFATGLEPLVDASLGFFVLAAFVGFARSSPWQYVAAAALSLSRYEAAALAPLLALANVAGGGRPLRHIAGAVLALLPLLAWRVAGSLFGPSGGSYLDLMAGMGFKPAPAYLGRVFGEAFPVLYAPGPLLAVALVLVGVPLLAGVVAGLRRERWLVATALAFFAVQTAAVVLFGIPKARYAQAVTWLPVMLWSVGAFALAERLRPHFACRPALRAAGALCVLLAGAAGIAFLQTRPGLPPRWLEPALALAGVAVAALAARARLREPAWLGVLACVALLLPTGLARQRTALLDGYHANHGSFVLGRWLRESLPEGGGIVVLNPGAVRHASGVPNERLATFGASGAESPEELAAFMRTRGIEYVAWTWRPPADSRSAGFYHEHKNVELAERFHAGGAVPGFRHVVSLEVPEPAGEEPVQVYRLEPMR